MRIGVSVLNYSHILGGGANYGLTLFQQWQRMGVDFIAYVRPKYASLAQCNGINPRHLRSLDVPGGDGGIDHIAAMVAWNNFVLDGHLRRDSIDILFQADLFGLVMRRKNLPVVSAVHGMSHWFFTSARSTAIYFRYIYKRVLSASDMLIAISNSTVDDLVRTWHQPPKNIRLVYNGIDQEHYSRRIDWLPWVDNFGIAAPYILYAGTLRVSKNVSALVEAFSMLSSSYQEHQLVLAGVGHDDGLLALIASKPDIANRVLMLKHVPNDVMPYLYSGCDVFAFPSLYEGHSLALMEAMACGCPILTSNFGSMLETVGEAAVCVNTYDVQSIADGLHRLLSDPELRQRMGAAARERVRQWTPEACAEGTLKVLDETWKDHRPRSKT